MAKSRPIHRRSRGPSFRLIMAARRPYLRPRSPRRRRSGEKWATIEEFIAAIRARRDIPIRWRMAVRDFRKILSQSRPIYRRDRRPYYRPLIAAKNPLSLTPFQAAGKIKNGPQMSIVNRDYGKKMTDITGELRPMISAVPWGNHGQYRQRQR